MNRARTINIILLNSIFIGFLTLITEAKLSKEEKMREFEEYLQMKREQSRKEDWSRAFNEDKKWHLKNNYDKFNENEHKYRRSYDPPPVEDAVLMARYIVNQADWTSVATISTRKDIESFPTVNLVSFSDGQLGSGSGIPYLYLTPLDFTSKDLSEDNRATLFMTLAEGDYCKAKTWDPMDPRCARVILTGKIKPIKNDSPELEIAKNAIFERHPALENMPADHAFYFAKLKIMSIAVLDTFGGPKYINVKDYLHALPNFNEHQLYRRDYGERYDYGNEFEEEYNMKSMNSFLNPTVNNV